MDRALSKKLHYKIDNEWKCKWENRWERNHDYLEIKREKLFETFADWEKRH